jgi:hypothetical protein
VDYDDMKFVVKKIYMHGSDIDKNFKVSVVVSLAVIIKTKVCENREIKSITFSLASKVNSF